MPRANDLMWFFLLVNLQGKSGLFCSPSTKSSSQFHGIIAILPVQTMAICKMWQPHEIILKKGPRGGS
jgi:hypothetical protein